MNIYVGNLSRKAFEVFGQVVSAKVITDKYTGVSRGFGFVAMPTKTEGESAITGLNDKELRGRTLKVNEARPHPQGPRSGGGRGGGRRSW